MNREMLQKLINENNREGLQEFLQKAACHRKEIVLCALSG